MNERFFEGKLRQMAKKGFSSWQSWEPEMEIKDQKKISSNDDDYFNMLIIYTRSVQVCRETEKIVFFCRRSFFLVVVV